MTARIFVRYAGAALSSEPPLAKASDAESIGNSLNPTAQGCFDRKSEGDPCCALFYSLGCVSVLKSEFKENRSSSDLELGFLLAPIIIIELLFTRSRPQPLESCLSISFPKVYAKSLRCKIYQSINAIIP